MSHLNTNASRLKNYNTCQILDPQHILAVEGSVTLLLSVTL